jgi:hypothetical protein
MDAMNKLTSTTLQSNPLTHFRLKNLSTLAQTTEDHISRLGMGLSMASGKVDADWLPTPRNSEKDIGGINAKQLRGRTLFKDDLTLWMALALRHQTPSDYEEWRLIPERQRHPQCQIVFEESSSPKLLSIDAPDIFL